MASNCNKYLEPTGVVLGKSTRVLGKVTLTTDGTYDSTKEYDRISLVYDPNTYISYISKQHVPAGTALSNTEYWQPLNSAILGPGQSLSGILNMLNSLNLPNVSGFLRYNSDYNRLEWVDVEQLIEIINNSGLELSLNEPLKSINSLNTSATQAGQILIYNGTQWKLDKISNVPQALGEPLKSIANLGTPSGTNKVIMYKNGSWSYQDASDANLGNLLTHINTKNAPVPTTSGYLYYNGSSYSWAAGTGGNTELGTLLTALKNTNYPPVNPAFLYYNGYGFTWYNSNVVVKWADIQNKPTTLSGYGITANDTLLTNLSGRITSLENKVPVALHEPILSINNINSNPATVGSILVYRENGWQFEEKPSGGTPGQTSYDDTWIYTWKDTLENQTIPGLRNTLSSVQNELNNKLSATENEIKGWIQDALDAYEWWKDNTIVDQIFHQSGWSDELEAYLQTVGVLDSNGNLNVSTITQTINSIDLRVRAIEQSGGSGSGDDDLITTLEAYCNQYIDNHEAIAQMGTMAAWLNENEDVIRWMTSGFKSTTARDGKQSFAEMYAIDKTAYTSSIAEIRADVSANQTDIGELKTARTTMASQITDIENMTGTSAVVTQVTALNNKLQGVETDVLASIDSKLAAFSASATLDQAVATMLADSGSGTYAAIQAIARDDDSFIGIVADRMGIDVETTTFTGNVLANSFQTGGSGNGIIVLGSAQDSFFNNSISGGSFALHNKAYFYHDGDSMNLAIYNDDESRWYKLDFSSLQLIHGGSYVPKTYYTISYNGGYVNNVIKKILYLNTVDSKYYSEPNSSGALVTGTYYEMNGATNDGYIYTDATTTVNVTNYTCVAFSNGEVVTGPSAPIGGPFYIGTIGGSSKNFVATGTSIIVDNETVYTGAPQSSGTDMTPAGNITWFSNSQTIQP